MGWFTHDDEMTGQLAAIAEYFGVGEVQEVTRLGGHANRNYQLITSSGKFVVKILLNHPRSDLEQGILYLQRLQEHGFPAAYYHASPQGSFIYQDNDQLAVLLPHVEGHVPEKSEQHCYEMGRQLARLHLIPKDGLPVKASWMQPSYLPEALEVTRQRLPQQETRRFLQEYERMRHFQPARLPQSIIHGDIAPPNCLFQDERLVALLDWEEVTIGASLMDLAISTLLLCFARAIFIPDNYRQLLEGYTAVRPLTREEEEQVENAIKYVGLTISTYMLLQFSLYYPDDQLKNMQEFYWSYHLDTWSIGKVED